MSKHTPGPWGVREAREMEGMDFDIVTDGPEYAVASLYCHMGESVEADARLIAAAPELLEALEYLVTADDAPTPGDREHTVREAISHARAAIAKARGKQ